MNKHKYVGVDVDQTTCVIVVEDGSGRAGDGSVRTDESSRG